MILSTIEASQIGYSGFGEGDKRFAIGHVRTRVSPTGERAPLACYVQFTGEGVEVGVYVGLFEEERDSQDCNPFRCYSINPNPKSVDDDVIQCLGLLSSVNVLVQGPYTVAHIDRQVVTFYKGVRNV